MQSAIVPAMLRFDSRPASCWILLLALLSASQSLAAPDLPRVTTARAVETTIVHEVTVTGSVVAPRVSRLSTKVAGWVENVQVEVGDRVERGQTLLELDAELGRIALETTRAAVAAARAQREEAERRLTEAERLAAQKTLPETELYARRAEARIAAATLQQREAESRREQALLDRHVLSAPYAGAISEKSSNAGEWVTPGTAVLELVEVDDLRIDFQVPQAFFPRLAAGGSVEIRFDAVPGRTLQAEILTAVPASDPQSRTFLLLTRLVAAELALIPGMSASGTIRLDDGRRGLAVPRDALLRHPDGRTAVWRVERAEDETIVREQNIEIGRAFDTLIEVTAGLAAGAEVVIRGNEGLVEGQRIVVDQAE